jgi:hypothetical protein
VGVETHVVEEGPNPKRAGWEVKNQRLVIIFLAPGSFVGAIRNVLPHTLALTIMEEG